MNSEKIDCVQIIDECIMLISDITGITNRFHLTNICIKLVDIAFTYYKEINQSEIRILIAYKPCVEHLEKIKEKIQGTQIQQSQLIEEFKMSIYQQSEL